MYGEINKKLRRCPWNTIDYLKHIDLKRRIKKSPIMPLSKQLLLKSRMSNFGPVGHIWPSMQLNPARNIISCQLLMIPQRPEVLMHCNSAIKTSTPPRCSRGGVLLGSLHSRMRLCVEEPHERGRRPSHCRTHVCYQWDLHPSENC